MCVNQKWTIQMKNSIDGVMLPQIDPFDKSVFYVSDGLHSTFPVCDLENCLLRQEKNSRTF